MGLAQIQFLISFNPTLEGISRYQATVQPVGKSS